MKPRQPVLNITDEDEEIFWWVAMRLTSEPPRSDQMEIVLRSVDADRRDADRMLRIMILGCRFCGSNSMHGEVHMPDCIYVIDPSARRVWLRKGARIIE